MCGEINHLRQTKVVAEMVACRAGVVEHGLACTITAAKPIKVVGIEIAGNDDAAGLFQGIDVFEVFPQCGKRDASAEGGR